MMIAIFCLIFFLIQIILLFKDKKNLFLLLIFGECFIGVVASVLTYGQTIIHSDIATPLILLKSIEQNRNIFPESYCYANGDVWFVAIHWLCFIPSLIFKKASLVRMVASAKVIILASLSIYYFSKKLFRDDSWMLSIPIMLLFIKGERSQIIYEAAYIQNVLLLVVAAITFFSLYTSQKKLSLSNICLILILMIASPVRYAAEILIPVLVSYLYLLYIDYKGGREISKEFIFDRILQILINYFAPVIMGVSIYAWICSSHSMGNTVNNSTIFVGNVQLIWDNVKMCIFDMFNCFGYTGGVDLKSLQGISNMISLSMCALVCFIVPFLQWKKISEESNGVKYFFVFTIIHNAIILLTCVFFGQASTQRYMLTSICLLIVTSARYIYVYWVVNRKDIFSKVLLIMFTICVLCDNYLLAYQSCGWKTTLAQEKELSELLISHNLSKGYATYWNAYKNELYSDMQIRFGGIKIVVGGLEPFYWLVDSSTYEVEETNTFLLLSEVEMEALDFNIISTFGTPIEEMRYNEYTILVFDHDIAGQFINRM